MINIHRFMLFACLYTVVFMGYFALKMSLLASSIPDKVYNVFFMIGFESLFLGYWDEPTVEQSYERHYHDYTAYDILGGISVILICVLLQKVGGFAYGKQIKTR